MDICYDTHITTWEELERLLDIYLDMYKSNAKLAREINPNDEHFGSMHNPEATARPLLGKRFDFDGLCEIGTKRLLRQVVEDWLEDGWYISRVFPNTLHQIQIGIRKSALIRQ